MAAITGAVLGIGSAAMSFVQASKQNQAMKKANTEAARLMADARKRAEVNQYEQLSIPTEAYEAEFEANLAADQQAIQALQEADPRSLAAGIGRVGAQQAEEAEKTRIEMGQDIYNLDKLKADSREKIKQQLIGMDVGQAADQEERARDAQEAKAAAIEGGIAGLGQAAAGFAEAAPLYKMGKADRLTTRGNKLKLKAQNLSGGRQERVAARSQRLLNKGEMLKKNQAEMMEMYRLMFGQE